MDVFTAMQTAVSGLKAQAFSLDNISGNIANSQTTGFKRVDTSFVDLVAEQQTPSRQVAGSVAANSRQTTTVQGNLNATDIGTNMALNGEGFFAVATKSGDANGQSNFATGDSYTRRGDFALDKDGYLVNGGGAYLKGSSLDPLTGQATGEGPIKVSNSIIPAHATTTITYSANLPKTPATSAADANKPNSELIGDSAWRASSTGAQVKISDPADIQKFVATSIAGPALTAYTPSGGPVGIQMRWAKVQNGAAANGATPATNDVWNLYYADKSTVSDSGTSWVNAGTDFQFNSSGQLISPASNAVTIPALTVGDVNLGNIQLNYGSGGLTAYTSAGGTVTTNTQTQDGYTSGTLTGLSITTDGKVSGTYSNGNTIALANIKVVQFTNSDGLKANSNGTYQQTLESGTALVGLNGTTVVGSNVEQSNTDIAGEFSKMIVTQQAYSANTKVISTAQDMMSALINIIR
ncbi:MULTISPECIES: flagellar hook-basal body complex protein [unclassified Methylobacterium]|uniref:flagellar hook protein FlgE n=1 Tax=unclassified Methylobacterium TaxID=2615210 RepID=UPI0006F1C75A|nr:MULTISPECIES: flagellar hook-basal body complex protein [unclassified Methylobacterium]KQO73207.1 flagellar biosynthesis protein FlgE [Methylobacterium sp. Leaf88]KQT81823.1 flagellar biosynthesis protein FlgE [Methylobacterium sp. Leaf465]KQU26362.1 flagellar biosynthesis protein FlgE [Methylobacterium sp. Leaf94]